MIFFFTAPATTEIYTLSLHDALPISKAGSWATILCRCAGVLLGSSTVAMILAVISGSVAIELTFLTISRTDRKSTRLNSSHVEISYAVFCLKKKKEK